MKYIFIIIGVVCLVFLYACSNNRSKTTNITAIDTNLNKQTDSLKWLFYAYTHKGKALLIRDQKVYEFNPIECDVQVVKEFAHNDSLFCLLGYYKEKYRYLYIREGFKTEGFIYFNGIAKPITGMLVYDNFEDPKYLKKNNVTIDSIFNIFLKECDTSKISSWLLHEAKRRRIIY